LKEQARIQVETYKVVKEIREAQQQCHCYDGSGTVKHRDTPNVT